MKSQVLHTVWGHISGEAAGEIWNWSLLGVQGSKIRALYFLLDDTALNTEFHAVFFFACGRFVKRQDRDELRLDTLIGRDGDWLDQFTWHFSNLVPALTKDESLGIALQASSPHVHNINLAMLRMRQVGFFEQVRRRWWFAADKCTKPQSVGELSASICGPPDEKGWELEKRKTCLNDSQTHLNDFQTRLSFFLIPPFRQEGHIFSKQVRVGELTLLLPSSESTFSQPS